MGEERELTVCEPHNTRQNVLVMLPPHPSNGYNQSLHNAHILKEVKGSES
jgi:hypothetical protein